MKIEEVLSYRGIIHLDTDIKDVIPVFVGTRAPLKALFDNRE